jgi:ABC-type transport system involved in Fe-S cluster assembly fused permease/ATPase subunit
MGVRADVHAVCVLWCALCRAHFNGHLLDLLLAFQTCRKTIEGLRPFGRGAAVKRIIELLLYNLVPIVAAIAVVFAVFVVHCEWTFDIVIRLMVTYRKCRVPGTRRRARRAST